MITKEQLFSWGQRHNYTVTKQGNLQKDKADGTFYRYKIGKNSVRFEHGSHIEYSWGEKKLQWVRLRSAYLKDLEITEDDKLKGMKF